MASQETKERLRRKLVEKKGSLGMSDDELLGAVGGYTPEHVKEMRKSMKELSREMEKLKTMELFPEETEKVAHVEKPLKPYCEYYDPNDSESEEKEKTSSSSSSVSPPPEIPLRTQEKKLQKGHMRCAERVYDYMLKCLGLRNPSVQQNEEYYDTCIGEAIMSLCIMYGDFWRERFEHVKRWMFKVDYFIVYCATILVERDGYYYFNYLIRMAIIFEMAWYCFDNNYDYFDVAERCTYRFVDFIFFRDEGDWPALKNAASVIAVLTRVLRFVVACPKSNVESFAGVIKQLEEYTTKGMVSMTRREISFLNDLKEKMLFTFRKIYYLNDKDKTDDAILELYWGVLLKYLKEYFPPGNSMSVTLSFVDSAELSLSLDSLVEDTEHFKLALEKYREFSKASETASDVSRRREIEEAIQHIDDAVAEARRERKEFKRMNSTPALNNPTLRVHNPTIMAYMRTCAVEARKRSTYGKDDLKYYRLDKRYVGDVIDLFVAVMPSLLLAYTGEYLVPQYAISDEELKKYEVVFVISKSYYKQREELLFTLASSKRMLGGLVTNAHYYKKGKIKTGPLRVVPIHLQWILDDHIKDRTRCQLLKGFQEPMLAIPGVKPLDVCPTWYVKEPLEKTCTNVIEAIVAIDQFEKMVKGGFFRTVKEETDPTAVLKFRFRSTANRITLPGQEPVSADKKKKRRRRGAATNAPQVPQTSAAVSADSKADVVTATSQVSAAAPQVPQLSAAAPQVPQTSARVDPKADAAVAAPQVSTATGARPKTTATAAPQVSTATVARPKTTAATTASQSVATDPQASSIATGVPPDASINIPLPSGQKKRRKKRSKK